MANTLHWLYMHLTDSSLFLAIATLIALIGRILYKYFTLKKTVLETEKLQQEIEKLRQELEDRETERMSKVVPATFGDVQKFDPKVAQIEEHHLRKTLALKADELARLIIPTISILHFMLVDMMTRLFLILLFLISLFHFFGQPR